MDAKTSNHLLAHLLFQVFRRDVEAISNPQTIGAYTPHGVPHILGVEESIRYIIRFHGYSGRHLEIKPARPLLPLELLLLRFCAWGHDLGMIQSIAEDYWKNQSDQVRNKVLKDEFLRKHHDKASAEHFCSRLPELFNGVVSELCGGRHDEHGRMLKDPEGCHAEYVDLLALLMPEADRQILNDFLRLLRNDQSYVRRISAEVTTLAYTVNLIARYHRRAELIAQCPEDRVFMGETIRVKLLAAIFRLADALNVDRTRFDKEFDLFRVLPEFTEENRVHWIKSFVVSSIGFDLQHHTVHIQADLPLNPDDQK